MELLTVEEVAKALRLSGYTVRRLLKEGKLKGVKLPGGHWRIPRSEVDTYLRSG